MGHLLRRAYALARKNTADALDGLGDISPVQASALLTLADGAMTQAALSRRIDMEPANTHGLIKRMAAAGLIDARPDPANRRLVLVALTDAGSALTPRIEERLGHSTEATLAALSPDESATLLALLRRLIAGTPGIGPAD